MIHFQSAGKLVKEAFETQTDRYDFSELTEGVNTRKHHIIKMENNEVKWVIDRICNHAGGTLITKGHLAVCPMHEWTLNLDTLIYASGEKKGTLPFDIVDNTIEIKGNNYHLKNPFKTGKPMDVSLRLLNHACYSLRFGDIKIITDPWLTGPAFMNGWWLKDRSPADAIQLLNEADILYISHNHPDHLHAETLSLVQDKNKPVIVPDFKSRSTEKLVAAMGFTNIIPFSFNEVYTCGDLQISILKSGDFRDDSGIYFCYGDKEILLTVDANYVNNYILPQNIDFLATSFAGGATGFPLCFENYTEEEKQKILARDKNAMVAKIIDSVVATRPKYYMPYAGFFKEYALRDKYIHDNSKKNSVDEISKSLARRFGDSVAFMAPDSSLNYTFSHELKAEFITGELLPANPPEYYIEQYKEAYPFSEEAILQYFEGVALKADLELFLVICDDDFNPEANLFFHYDFSTGNFGFHDLVLLPAMYEAVKANRKIKFKVRRESLMCVIENRLPWEDLSIGFQMRIEREPNAYNIDFWHYFTNEYIGREHYRYSPYCGSCNIIDQNKFYIPK